MAIDIKAQSRKLFDEVWSQGRVSLLEDLIDPAYQGREPLVGGMNRDGLKKAITAYRNAFPDLKFTVNQVNVDGDNVVVQWTAKGTQRAALLNLPATGKSATISGITCAEYKAGKLLRDHTEWDTLSLFRQLGVQQMTQLPITPQAGAEARH